MIFLAPAFLIAAGIIAAGVVALHFLSTREPDTELLPTVRFVPDVPVQATKVTVRFTDPWLLLLRVLLILLLGAALARPLIHPFAQSVARIAVVDVSRAVANPGELADSASGHVEGAAAVVLFDDRAREVGRAAADSLEALREAPRGERAAATRGSLSTALIAALRIASRLRDGADSLQLVVVSPFAREERDAATERIRALWPGRIDAIQAGGAPPSSTEEAGGPPTPERIEWADSGAAELWLPREPPDTIGGVRARDAVMVHSFVRRWRPAPNAAASGTPAIPDPDDLRVYARWMDGEPAAFERATPGGCVRSLAIPLPTEGDAILRPDFQRFLAELEDPCGEPGDLSPLSEGFMATFRGDDGPLASSSLVERQVRRVTPAVPWILAFALLVALAEIWLRRRLAAKEAGGAHGHRADPSQAGSSAIREGEAA